MLSIRYNVIGEGHPGEQERFYNKLALMINDAERTDHIKQQVLRFYPKDEIFEQDFLEKSYATVPSSRRARYLLARLEEFESHQAINEEDLTVEHILPLKPNEHWLDYFKDNYHQFNQRIGNMALVTRAENQALGQKPFAEKRGILMASNYQINQWVDYDEWGVGAITTRQEKLAKIATRLWRID